TSVCMTWNLQSVMNGNNLNKTWPNVFVSPEENTAGLFTLKPLIKFNMVRISAISTGGVDKHIVLSVPFSFRVRDLLIRGGSRDFTLAMYSSLSSSLPDACLTYSVRCVMT